MPQKLKPALPIPIPERLLQWWFTGSLRERPCSHLQQIEVWESDLTVCPDCVEAGDDWPSLRLCMSCGYVGCCDQSKNKHMKKHVEATGHPVVRSIDPGDAWMWCYPDEAFIRSNSPQLPERGSA